MQIINHPSPNFDRRQGHYGLIGPQYIIAHYTGGVDTEKALARLCDGTVGENNRVSANYFIDADGTVRELVSPEYRAWHAGISQWHGERDMNSAAIGIELDHRGRKRDQVPNKEWARIDPEWMEQDKEKPFSDAQIESFSTLCQQLMDDYNIPAQNVLGHSDIAPMRKADPGELFPWQKLAQQGIGVWPQQPGNVGDLPTIADCQQALQRIGYDCPQTGIFDYATCAVVLAFQRHFMPEELKYHGLTPATRAQIAAVEPLFAQSVSTATVHENLYIPTRSTKRVAYSQHIIA